MIFHNQSDIIFLTNMPHPFRETRRSHLSGQGLDFPLITNTRSKVPAIQVLKEHCNHAVGFIDDTPKNLDQVRERGGRRSPVSFHGQ